MERKDKSTWGIVLQDRILFLVVSISISINTKSRLFSYMGCC